jgi:dienelactone hydrolase
VDSIFGEAARAAAEKLLDAQTGRVSNFHVYPETVHGFSIRGDELNPIVVKARDHAVEQVAAFFNEYKN